MFTDFQAQCSTEKQNPNSIVLEDTKASFRGLDRLHPTVESFGWSVAHGNHVTKCPLIRLKNTLIFAIIDSQSTRRHPQRSQKNLAEWPRFI